jgi:glycine cleavage system H protein
MNFPEDLYYTNDHEWIRIENDDVAVIGITDFAQSELGDIVFVEIDSLGNEVAKEEVFGTVEAVKTVSELFAPVSGTVTDFNEEIESSPEAINDDPYGAGWIIKIKMSDLSEIDQLLTADAYSKMVG